MSYVAIGRVMKEWGVKGGLKVTLYDFDCAGLKTVFIERETGIERFELTGMKMLPKNVIFFLNGVDTPEAASGFRDLGIYIERDESVALGEWEFYVEDILGLSAVTTDGRPLGTVTDVLTTQASDIYVIVGDGRETLVPAVAEFIAEIDIERGFIKINPIEGL